MRGQTMIGCTGKKWDEALQVYANSECAGNPHGGIVFVWDVKNFLEGEKFWD